MGEEGVVIVCLHTHANHPNPTGFSVLTLIPICFSHVQFPFQFCRDKHTRIHHPCTTYYGSAVYRFGWTNKVFETCADFGIRNPKIRPHSVAHFEFALGRLPAHLYALPPLFTHTNPISQSPPPQSQISRLFEWPCGVITGDSRPSFSLTYPDLPGDHRRQFRSS